MRGNRERKGLLEALRRNRLKAGAVGATLVLVALVALFRRSPEPIRTEGGVWAWILPGAEIRAYVDLAQWRETPTGKLVARKLSSPASSPDSLLASLLEGRNGWIDVEEIAVGIRLPGPHFPTGQVSAVFTGEFDFRRLYEKLAQGKSISFSREVNGFEVHRLRVSPGIPPEVIVLDEKHVLVCDAQSTAEILDPRRPSSAAPSGWRGAVLWAEGRVDKENLSVFPFPEGTTRIRFSLCADRTEKGFRIETALRSDGDPEEFEKVLHTVLDSVRFFSLRGAGGKSGDAAGRFPVTLRRSGTTVNLSCELPYEKLRNLVEAWFLRSTGGSQ